MKEPKLVPQNPIILRCHRVMEAFARSDDERDFYLDKIEGFLIHVDLDKPQEELDALFKEIHDHRERYVLVPKLTFYEVKKVMEQFANEKVYDIDTKEKLLDIIQSREARENFLEFIYDHHTELEKWQQFYQERFRIRIIEWLRNHSFDFVFEEDIELTKSLVENVKINMFTPRASKDVIQARKILTAKAATYYSSEALNPRPKRGRPPKQVVKVETEPQFAQDIYVAVPKAMKPFLFTPDYNSNAMIFTFSGKFASEEDLLAHRRQQLQTNLDLTTLSQKLAALKALSTSWQKEQTESFSDALLAEASEAHTAKSFAVAKEELAQSEPPVKAAVNKKSVKAEAASKSQAPVKSKLPVKGKAPPKSQAPVKSKLPVKSKAASVSQMPVKGKFPVKSKAPPKSQASVKSNQPVKGKAPPKSQISVKSKLPVKDRAPMKKASSVKKSQPFVKSKKPATGKVLAKGGKGK